MGVEMAQAGATLLVAPADLVASVREPAVLRREVAQMLAAAHRFGQPVDIALLAGDVADARDRAEVLARLPGVRRIWLLVDARLGQWLAEPCAAALQALVVAEGHVRIIGHDSMAHRDVLGRLAGLLQAPALSDVVAVEAPEVVRRPMHAGAIVADVRIEALPVVLLVRGAAFAGAAAALLAEADDAGHEGHDAAGAEIVVLDPMPDLPVPVKLEDVMASGRDDAMPDLARARIVLGMGRGAATEPARSLLMQLARRLGAAVAATRAVVDEGLAPGDWQVGQTGKRIAPQLYVAFGISGAHQHVAGIADARVIVAVNRDADAPIFKVADFGIVADVETVLRDMLMQLPSRAEDKPE